MLLGMRSPKVGPTPIGSWDASTSTLAQLAALVSHSRTSLATMFDSTGKLTYAPNNLLRYSNTFSNAAWTKTSLSVSNANAVDDPFGGTNATTITATGTNGEIYQSFASAFVGATALPSIWVRRRTGSGLIRMYAATGTPSTVTVTGSWTQIYVNTTNVASGTVYFGLRIATSGDAIDIYAGVLPIITYETTPRAGDQVITTSSAYYGPRIDYDPNTLAVKGLLIEEARTNLVVNSNQFTSWAISGGSSVATNSNTQIDGTTNGNTFSLVAGVSGHQIYKSYTGTAVAYTNSVYAKAGTSSWLGMWFVSTAQADGAFFNLSNGTIGTVAAGTTAAIQSIGNGWYRCSITKTLTAATYYNGLEVHTADNQAYNFNAAGTESLYLFGAQGELGSFATSYIPTAAASVTRAADVVQFTGAALTALQGSAASFFVEQQQIATNAGTGNGRLSGNASGNPFFYLNGNIPKWRSNDGNDLATPTITNGSLFRTAIAWNASGRSADANGGTVVSDAKAITYTGMYLGSDGLLFINEWVKSFAIYNQRLADGTLQSKSVVGASY